MFQYIKFLLLIVTTLTCVNNNRGNGNPISPSAVTLSDCEIEVEVPLDFLVCAGQDFTLLGNINSSYDSFIWCADGQPTGLDLEDITSITEETTFTLKATYDSGDNLVINGDFESGDGGFTTDYVSVGPGSSDCYGAGYLDCEGTYSIIDDPSQGHTNFNPCTSDNMMVVNGAANFQNIWCQDICVSPNSSYVFGAQATSVNPSSPGLLQFSINGEELGSVVGLSSPCSWVAFEEPWEANGETNIQICILNENTASGGNDFAIDNITFFETCREEASVTVFVSEVEIEIEEPEEIDCNTPEITILTNIFANGISQIEWYSPDGNIIDDRLGTEIIVNEPGLYSVTVTDDTGCTKEEFTEVFPGNSLVELELMSDGPITCDNPEVIISINTPTQNLDYKWYDADNNLVGDADSLSVTEAGLYSLFAESQNSNCTIEKDIIIEVDTIRPFFTASKSNDINCFNENSTLSVNIQSDSLKWQTPATYNTDVIGRSTFQTNIPGTYIASLENDNGCSHSDTVTVLDIPSVINYTLDYDELINCNSPNSEVIINIDTSLFNISWTSLSQVYNDSLSFTLDQAGTYYVSFLDSLGCEKNDSIIIMSDFTSPTLGTVSASEIDCNNNISTIVADNPSAVDIIWLSQNGITGNGNNFEVSQSGYVRYEYTGSNGCSMIDSVEVIASGDLPIISINGEDLSCILTESTLSVNSNLPLTSFEWTGPNGPLSVEETIEIEDAGSYQVEVISDLGCLAIANINISIDTIAPEFNLPPDATLDCDISTYEGMATINGSYSELIYENDWYNENSNTISISEPGNYSIKVIGNNGCESESSMNVDIDTTAILFSIQGDSILNCSTSSVIAELQSNESYRSLSWTGNNFSSNQESILIEDPGTYTLSVTNDNGCVTLADHIITEDISTPNFMAMATEIDCAFPFSTVIVNPLDEITETNYYDEFGDLIGTGNSLSTDYTGIITIEVIGTNGCENSDQIQAQVNVSSFNFDLVADSLSCDQNSVLIDFTYNLNYETAIIKDQNNNIVGDILTPITEAGIYTVEVTLDNGCSSSSDIEIFSDDNNIEFTILDGELDCDGTPLEVKFFTLDDYDSAVILNSNGDVLGDENILINEVGTYSILITGINGCERTEDFVIREPSNPIEFIEYITYIEECQETVLFYASDVSGGTPPYDYLIDGVSPPAATDNFITGVGTHNIYIEDAKGCIIDTTFSLAPVDPVIINTIPEIEVTYGENQQLQLDINRDLSEIQSISWTEEKDLTCYDCLDPIYTGNTNATYQVVVIDNNGCVDEIEVRIRIDRVIIYYVPNVIRLSDDNDNAFTIFSATDEIEEIESLLIYDRWGNNMYYKENFSANDTSLGWDGYYNDIPVEQGVYVYHAVLRLANGEVESIAGDITVLR